LTQYEAALLHPVNNSIIEDLDLDPDQNPDLPGSHGLHKWKKMKKYSVLQSWKFFLGRVGGFSFCVSKILESLSTLKL
jgi:hypothetical protein